MPSLPSRERGLKFLCSGLGSLPKRSLPSRERGLKLMKNSVKNIFRKVAPLTGAWIEIKI